MTVHHHKTELKIMQNIRKIYNFVNTAKYKYSMKKLFSILCILILLTACGKSEEEKLNDLIAETTKASLYIPDSYDPVSTQCDSMSRTVINPANIKKSAKIISLVKEAQSIQREIEINTEQRDYWRGKYGEFYNDYSKKVSKGEAEKAKLMTEAEKLFSELSRDYYAHKEFCGYIVEHKFRAKNNMGNILFGDVIYILNKDKIEVIDAYDTSDDDFIGFIQIIDAIIEAGKDYSRDRLNLEDICDNINSRFEL